MEWDNNGEESERESNKVDLERERGERIKPNL